MRSRAGYPIHSSHLSSSQLFHFKYFRHPIISVGMTGPHLERNLSFIGGEEVVRSEVMDPSSTFSAKANTEDPYEGEASEETGL
ncbi:hypothetical protein TNCV_3358601 [Trichonephila clavipes]|nr:hypothetical protein TNCV_3358601 [Trichonephila clavipes]